MYFQGDKKSFSVTRVKRNIVKESKSTYTKEKINQCQAFLVISRISQTYLVTNLGIEHPVVVRKYEEKDKSHLYMFLQG